MLSTTSSTLPAVLHRHIYGTDRHVEVYEATGDDFDGRYGIDQGRDGTSAITLALQRTGHSRLEPDGTHIDVSLNGDPVTDVDHAGVDHRARRQLAARVRAALGRLA